MNLLALDTSTELFTLAVQHDAGILEQQGPGGANASSALIPAIQALLARAGLRLAQLDAIVFGRGPGSFTGLRTACSVAQGLAFGAQVPVLGIDTLLALAEDARARAAVTKVVAVLDARMEQVYSAAYAFEHGTWREERAIALGAPEDVVLPAGWTLAGNASAVYGRRLPAGDHIEAHPAASAMVRLAPTLLARGDAVAAAQALPLYIRDKVAQTTDERAAARAAAPSSR